MTSAIQAVRRVVLCRMLSGVPGPRRCEPLWPDSGDKGAL